MAGLHQGVAIGRRRLAVREAGDGYAVPGLGGFARGIERLLALWREQGDQHEVVSPDAYLVHQGEAAGRFAFRVAEALRSAGFAIQLHCGGGGFKSQMKKADGSGAAYAVIIGDDEAAAGEVTLKVLRSVGEEKPEQLRVKVDDLAQTLMDSIIDWDEE